MDISFRLRWVNSEELGGASGETMFNFARRCQTVLGSGCAILHAGRQRVGAPRGSAPSPAGRVGTSLRLHFERRSQPGDLKPRVRAVVEKESVQISASCFNQVICFPMVEFSEFFVYLGYKFLRSYTLCRYFFPHVWMGF